MLKLWPRLIGCLCVLGISSPAAADGASDVKCILASNIFIKAARADSMRKIAGDAAFFYLGRMDRYNTAQLRALIVQQKKTITTANAGAVMNACARNMANAGKAFDTLTQDIDKHR